MEYSDEEIQQIIQIIDTFPCDIETILEEKYCMIELFGNNKYDPKNLRLLSNLIKLYNDKYVKWRTEYYIHKEQIKQNQAIPFDFITCKYQLNELEKLVMNNL
jgi:hypothetical protein